MGIDVLDWFGSYSCSSEATRQPSQPYIGTIKSELLFLFEEGAFRKRSIGSLRKRRDERWRLPGVYGNIEGSRGCTELDLCVEDAQWEHVATEIEVRALTRRRRVEGSLVALAVETIDASDRDRSESRRLWLSRWRWLRVSTTRQESQR